MTEKRTPGAVTEAATDRYCGSCGNPTEPGAEYCGECGHSVVADGSRTEPTPERKAAAGPVGAPNGGQGWPPPPFPTPAAPTGPGLPTPYPHGYPAPVERSGQHVGLILGLVGAAILAIGAIVAVVLLATSGSGGNPTVTTARSSASISPNSSAVPGSGAAVLPTLQKLSSAPPAPSPPPNAPTPAQAASASDAQQVRDTVTRHWDLINQGDYAGAWALLNPDTNPGQSSWIADKQQDKPRATIQLGSPTFSSSTSANLPVLSLRTVGTSGCNNWTGSYDLTKVNGTWLISHANLQQNAC